MAYNDTPLPTDLISDSQSEIRENFQLLEDSQVVDEGSTDDGDYIRWENGWQVCMLKTNMQDENVTDFDFENSSSVQGLTIYRKGWFNWTFPQSFLEPPYRNIIIDGDDTGLDTRYGQFTTRILDFNSTTEFNYNIITLYDYTFSEAETTDIVFLAIGRWE